MPKIPGRESTRKTVDLEFAMVASFLMPWEHVGKPCCITGCEHRIDGRLAADTGLGSQEFCGRGNAATIYDERRMPGPKPDPYVGMACPCHVEQILGELGP